jgi:hypothetical protein
MPPFGNVASPSPSTDVRLDIRKGAAGYEAVFHPRFSPSPSALTVTLTADSVLLEGTTTLQALSSGYAVSDHWSSISLARSPDGGLAGPFAAVGSEDAFGGDVIDSTTLTGSGSLSPDNDAPAFSESYASFHGPTDALLPWDALGLSLSEGIATELLLPHLGVFSDGAADPSPAVAWSFSPAPAEAAGWAGAVGAEAFSASWDAVQGHSVGVTVTPGAPDPSGNTGPAFMALAKVLYVGSPAALHDFDSDITTTAQFGAVTLLGGFAGSDPHCEQGGCARLGPFESNVCGPGGIGLAGRLKAAAGSTVSIRYRIAVAGDQAGPQPQLFSSAFGLDLHDHAGKVSSPSPEPTPMQLHTLAAIEDDLAWTSDWLTATRAVEGIDASGDVGFVLYAGNGTGACGGPLPPPVKMAVFIDSISVE